MGSELMEAFLSLSAGKVVTPINRFPSACRGMVRAPGEHLETRN